MIVAREVTDTLAFYFDIYALDVGEPMASGEPRDRPEKEKPKKDYRRPAVGKANWAPGDVLISSELPPRSANETDARDAQARLLDALDRMDFVIVHRESIRLRDDQS